MNVLRLEDLPNAAGFHFVGVTKDGKRCPALLNWAKTAATRLQGPHGVTWRAGAVGNHQLTCQAERNRNDNRTDAPTTVEPL